MRLGFGHSSLWVWDFDVVGMPFNLLVADLFQEGLNPIVILNSFNEVPFKHTFQDFIMPIYLTWVWMGFGRPVHSSPLLGRQCLADCMQSAYDRLHVFRRRHAKTAIRHTDNWDVLSKASKSDLSYNVNICKHVYVYAGGSKPYLSILSARWLRLTSVDAKVECLVITSPIAWRICSNLLVLLPLSKYFWSQQRWCKAWVGHKVMTRGTSYNLN